MIHMSMKKEVFMILTYIIFTKWQNLARSWWRLIRFTKILFCYKKHTHENTHFTPKSNNNKIKYTYYNFLEWRHQCLFFLLIWFHQILYKNHMITYLYLMRYKWAIHSSKKCKFCIRTKFYSVIMVAVSLKLL